jgi:hypothetical protein
MSNPWDDRPWATDGERSENDLFLAVGRALSHWELAEHAIASLFSLVTVGSYFDPSAPTLRAYSSVPSTGNRIQLVRAALEGWLHEWVDCPLGGNAVSLLIECSGWAGRRNDIAHGLVDRFADEYERGWFLIPGIYSKRGRNEKGKIEYRYNTAIIDAFTEHFLDLHNRLNVTVSAMGEWHRVAAG